MVDEKLISCLCVTRRRPKLLQRSVNCFLSQTYQNRELIIVYEDDDKTTMEALQQVKDKRIKILEVGSSPKRTLGELRNLSIEQSKGEYLCQWDDDDWYHNDRLKWQMFYINQSQKPGSILVNWTIFDEKNQEAYISFVRPWEGSLLLKKDIIDKEGGYPHLSKGEDMGLIIQLVSKNHLCPVIMPWLYIYVVHGNNVFERQHFQKFFDSSQRLSRESSRLIKQILDNKFRNDHASSLLLESGMLMEIDYFRSSDR